MDETGSTKIASEDWDHQRPPGSDWSYEKWQWTEASIKESSEAAMLDFWLGQTNNAEWEEGSRFSASSIDVSFELTNVLFM